MDTPSKSDAPQAAVNAEASPAIPMPRLSLWRRMQIPVIAWAVYWVIRLIGPTLRTEVVGVHNAIQIPRGGEPAIGAFWHRCIFPAAWIWRGRGIVVLNTVNFDGQWTRRVIERLGFGTAQGSSTRGAIEGLTAMARQLEAGRHVAFTIDGPRGPRFVAKRGSVLLSKATGAAILCFHSAARRRYVFRKSWDMTEFPLPFSRAATFIAPPVVVSRDASEAELARKLQEVQTALNDLRRQAEAWQQGKP